MFKTQISAKARIQWATVFNMTAFWCVVGVLLALYKSVNYNSTTQEMVFAAPKEYDMISFILINLVGPLIAGAIAAPLIVFYLKERLKAKSYLTFIGTIGLAFFLVILILNTSVSWIFYYQNQPWGPEFSISDFLRYFLLDPYALRNILTWLLVGFITVTMLQISDKYGPGVFNKFLRGKYYNPQEEERIFMFLDLNNSTSIAEKLGNVQFFKLLNTYFADITDSILDSHGEIYQYVGDEIVVSWTTGRGLNNANCIQCFFEIKKEISKKSSQYQGQFGVVPEFKGGIHVGKVIVGEIGIIKKDIVYSGDVLNTTARILELSKHYQQKLIITQTLYERLASKPTRFNFQCLGQIPLRGKDTQMDLWTVSINHGPVNTPVSC